MSILLCEEWGDIVEFPMFTPNIWMCYQDARWLVKLLLAKYELVMQDLNGCLDSELL